MGNNESKCRNDSGNRVFNNHLIVGKIMDALPSKDVRNLRSLNKMTNHIGCSILHKRGSAMRKIDSGHQMSLFLRTIDNRLDTQIPFAAFSLDVSKISFEGLAYFCNAMKGKVRNLTINLTASPQWRYYAHNFRGAMAFQEWNNGKLKALQVLSKFPYIETLCLEFNAGAAETRLTPEDLMSLPNLFPNLAYFRWEEAPGTTPLPFSTIRSLTLLSTSILERSPNLRHVILLPRFHSANLIRVPEILNRFKNPPALSFHSLSLTGTGALPFSRNHFNFFRELSMSGFHNIRNLHLSLNSPTDSLLNEVNRFLAIQADTLETLILRLKNYPSRNRRVLVFPVLPKLTWLDVKLRYWELNEIQPHPMVREQFPALTSLTIQQNIGIFAAILKYDTRLIGSTRVAGKIKKRV